MAQIERWRQALHMQVGSNSGLAPAASGGRVSNAWESTQ